MLKAAGVQGVLAGVVVAVALAGCSADARGVVVRGKAQRGKPAPEVEMTDFEGDRFALSDYRGTPVVLNFWASWCPPCTTEMPDFEKVHRSLEGRVAFLGLNQRDDKGPAADLAERTGVTYRLAHDPRGRVYDAFGGFGMPTTVFISSDGDVVETVSGLLSEQQLRALISEFFGVVA